MLDVILFVIALGAGGGASDAGAGETTAQSAAPTAPVAETATGFEAEDQTPSGKFLTATEVRPILGATRANWVAVRDYNGQDLLYLTHLLAWRCGLHQIEYGVNGGPMQVWPMPACHVDGPAPGALLPEDGLPYVGFPPGSIETVEIRLLYDDMGVEEARFDRASVQIN